MTQKDVETQVLDMLNATKPELYNPITRICEILANIERVMEFQTLIMMQGLTEENKNQLDLFEGEN